MFLMRKFFDSSSEEEQRTEPCEEDIQESQIDEFKGLKGLEENSTIQINELNDKITELERQIKRSNEQVRQSNEFYEQIYEIVKELHFDHGQLQPIIKNIKMLSRIDGQLSTAIFDIKQLEQKINVPSDIEGLENKIMDMKKEFAGITNKIGDIKKELQKDISSVNEEVINVKKGIQKQIVGTDKEIVDTKREFQKEFVNIKSEIENLEEIVNRYSVNIEKLETRLEKLEFRPDPDIEDLEIRLNKLETDSVANKGNCQRLVNQMRKISISSGELECLRVMWNHHRRKYDFRKRVFVEFMQKYTCTMPDGYVDYSGFKIEIYQHFLKYGVSIESWEIDIFMGELNFFPKTLKNGQTMYSGLIFSNTKE